MFRDDDHQPLRVNYFAWLTRVAGWDAALPLLIALIAAQIGRAFQQGAGADILALVGLPAAAFLLRLSVGVKQIGGNACGRIVRGLQVVALMLGLIVLSFLDFFVALVAFNPNNGIDPGEIALTVTIGSALYLTAATFAMYPGRTRKVVNPWREMPAT